MRCCSTQHNSIQHRWVGGRVGGSLTVAAMITAGLVYQGPRGRNSIGGWVGGWAGGPLTVAAMITAGLVYQGPRGMGLAMLFTRQGKSPVERRVGGWVGGWVNEQTGGWMDE